jgi:hypothetical protein
MVKHFIIAAVLIIMTLCQCGNAPTSPENQESSKNGNPGVRGQCIYTFIVEATDKYGNPIFINKFTEAAGLTCMQCDSFARAKSTDANYGAQYKGDIHVYWIAYTNESVFFHDSANWKEIFDQK